MAERDYLAAVNSRVVIFDGGMGATLEQFDLTQEDYMGLQGKCHEALVLQRPDVIEGVHTSMIEAGAEVLETDTFQASRIKLEEWGLADHTVEINQKAAEIARKAAGDDKFVAGSIGPTGHLPASDDPTLGKITFPELVEVFTEQAEGLINGGADLIIIETAQDILEVKAAVFGAREAFKSTGRTLPIQTSVSLLPNGGKMLLGTDIEAVLTTLSALDVQVIGLNCSTGPEDMRDAIRYLGENCPVPVHCIPNAGIPIQGPEGETIFPEEPDPLANALQEFVEKHGVGIVGGCCGTTPDHIRAIVDRVGGREVGPRPKPGPPMVSSMMSAAALAQEPAPTIVGERVNSQGSRKAKELLLADDYDGLLQIATNQVEGGAHVLDLCVALTEREDEDEQMRQLAKRVSLALPAPLQIDSTEPDVMKRSLEQTPGRAIVNSVNLEAGRDKLDTVVPLAKAHGAALIALTIDEVGMAKTRDRKLEIAQRLKELICDEHGLDPELLIFDALTFTLTTGDEEWRPSAIETIEGIKLIKENIPSVKTSLGVSNVSFGVSPNARRVLNSVFLHHCVEAGLDLAMVHPAEVTPYAEIPDNERELTDNLVFNKSEDALEKFIEHFESKGEEAEDEAADPTADMEPEEALHWHILRRKKEGVEDQIDKCNEKIGAVPTLNTVLLPAMKEVGDKFGAGELILPVRAPVGRGDEAGGRPARELPREDGGPHEGHRGDRHRVRRRARHRQVAGEHDHDQQRLHGRSTSASRSRSTRSSAPRWSTRPTRSGSQPCSSPPPSRCRSASRSCTRAGSSSRCWWEARPSTATSAAACSTRAGKDSDETYDPGVFYCKDAFQGLDTMDALIDDETRAALVEKIRTEADDLRNKPVEVDDSPPVTDDSVRSSVATDNPVPEPPFWGVREIDVPFEEVYPYLDRHVLFKLHWGGRGKKGEEWRQIVEGHDGEEGFAPKLERMWKEQDYLEPRARIGYFPANSDGNDLVVFDPEDHDKEIHRLTFPRQPKHDRICLADFYKPIDSGERDVVAIQGVTVGPKSTERLEQLEKDGEFSEQLFTHGLAVQSAEGLAEWLHAQARKELGIDADQGRRYSWGYPACPDQSEHEKVWELLELDQIGMYLSDGFAVMPEQSTVAIIAHHPQAVYFGMKSGFVPKEKKPDELIAGTDRGGELPPDEDPPSEDGTIEAEDEGRAADEVPV